MVDLIQWGFAGALFVLVAAYFVEALKPRKPKGVVSHTILEWRTDFENVPVGVPLLLMAEWNGNKCFIGNHLDVRQASYSAYAILEAPKL